MTSIWIDHACMIKRPRPVDTAHDMLEKSGQLASNNDKKISCKHA